MDVSSQNDFARFNRLSEEQISRIHNASLEILERIGIRVYLPEAIALFEQAGATVEDGNLVRIPSSRVEWALKAAPKQVTLYNRLGEPAVALAGGGCFYGPGSDCLNIIDHRTGSRRRPVLNDVVEGTRLCDALDNIDFVMSMVLPTDVDQTIADVYQMRVMLANSVKPIVYVSYEANGLVDAVEMAEAVVGGADNLRAKPIITCYINVVSGAVHNDVGLQKLLYLAGKGLPILYIPGSSGGVTSPITMAGAVALDLAGGLAGLVLSQLVHEGTPYIISAMDPAALDMRTMVGPYAYPERGIIRSMAQSYHLPSFSLAGGSDAKVVDQQAAAEAALTLLADTLMGGNLIHDLGYLESGLTYSFIQLAICNEIVGWIKAYLKPVEVSDETLALDLIAQVGAHGQYLKTGHTRKHVRDTWYPELFERGTFNDWVQKGSQTLVERAAVRIQKILAEHQVEPLGEGVQERLAEIVKRAEAKKN
jgi:trimethylamine--corrinoid protein Co-methyltransferase